MTISTDRDKVRLLVGDTDESDPILQDDEIQHFIAFRSVLDPDTGGTIWVNVNAAAADAAGAIAAEFARQFDFEEDGQRFSRSQRVGQYMALERELRNRSGGFAVPMGGTVAP